MGYVTNVVRSSVATSDGVTLSATLGLTLGATLISVGAVVATPSSSGNVPDTVSETAKLVWVGPGNASSAGSTITPSSGKAVATDVSEGEALWLMVTELQ